MKNLMAKTVAVALLCSSALAQAGAIDVLKKFNHELDGLTGNFSQTVQSKKKTQNTSGSFQVLRPGLFKWEYKKPMPQVIVGDGNHVWLYDVEMKQVTKSSQNQAIGDSPAAILSSKDALESNFDLKEDGNKGGVDYVLATPKSSGSNYRFIRIGFKGETLTAMELKDSFGNLTNIRFSAINSKPNLSKGQFTFTPPKGVDVSEQ